MNMKNRLESGPREIEAEDVGSSGPKGVPGKGETRERRNKKRGSRSTARPAALGETETMSEWPIQRRSA